MDDSNMPQIEPSVSNYDPMTVSLTPNAVEKQPALLKQSREVYVNVKDIQAVDCSTETSTFNLDLCVVVDGKSAIVTRQLVIDHATISAEALNIIENRKTVFIENKESSSDMKKLRWLAGISYD